VVADLFSLIGVVPLDKRKQVADKKILIYDKVPKSMSKLASGLKFAKKSNDYAQQAAYIIKETDDENKRLGGWKRIFPC